MESKLITGKDRRVEIRHTTSSKSKKHKWFDHAQILIVVYPDGEVRFSANGTVSLHQELLEVFADAINKAKKELTGVK